MPPTGDGTGWDGTFDFNHKPTQDDNDDCCGNDTMWFAGGGSCIIPSDPNKNTASQVEDACNQKNTCAWSKTTKTCVHKSCARRTNSHDCQTAFQGSDTSRNIPQCLWIGESGGAGRCIEGNCYNRCNANDCTTPIQDNRHSVHGPCMWVDNVENDILESSQCKTANLLAQQQDGGGAPQPGVCMPLECTHRGDFQPSKLKFNKDSSIINSICSGPSDNCEYFGDDPDGQRKTAFMQHAMAQQGELSCTALNTSTPSHTVHHPTCCMGVEEKDDKTCNAHKTRKQCQNDGNCQLQCRDSSEMCVWRKDRLQCVPARAPRCVWHSQATNPKDHICSAIGAHATRSPRAGSTAGPVDYQSSNWYLKSMASAKGACVEDHGTFRPTHLDGTLAKHRGIDDVNKSHMRSSNYEDDCICHFAPLGYCENFDYAECPSVCMRVGGNYCTSRAFEFCQNTCQQLHPHRQAMCPYGDQSGNTTDDWLHPQTAKPDVVSRCKSNKSYTTCTHPCTWDAEDEKCVPIPHKLSSATYTCNGRPDPGDDSPSTTCLQNHSISEYRLASCGTLKSQDACTAAGCQWGGDGTCSGEASPHMAVQQPHSCMTSAAQTAMQRNTCFEMCMRTPEEYCESVCHTTGCAGSCYRHHMGSMAQWKSIPQCNSSLHLKRNPEYHQWRAECSQAIQGDCIDIPTNTACQRNDENSCTQNAKCLWKEGACVARPVITRASAGISPENQELLKSDVFANSAPSPRILEEPDPTCSKPNHAWSQPVLYDNSFCSPVSVVDHTHTHQCSNHTSEQDCKMHKGCQWSTTESQCTTESLDKFCNASLVSCNPSLCNNPDGTAALFNHSPYCPCQNGEMCYKWPTTCKPKEQQFQSMGVADSPETATTQKCVTHKCASKYLHQCHLACHVKSEQKVQHRMQDAAAPPVSCPANMPWMYGRRDHGGLYCCSSYMGTSHDHTKTYSSLDACIHGGASGSYNVPPLDQATSDIDADPKDSYHFVAQKLQTGCCATPGLCWPHQGEDLPPNCDGSHTPGLTCSRVVLDPLKKYCSREKMQALEAALENGDTSTPLDYGKCNTSKEEMPHLEPACPAFASKDAPTPPPRYPAPCLHEQCVHHYCDPKKSPDLLQLFPMHMEGKMNSAPNLKTPKSWPDQCALRYCASAGAPGQALQVQGCTTDIECADQSGYPARCVQECGESGYGCVSLWHDNIAVCGTRSSDIQSAQRCARHTTVEACQADAGSPWECKLLVSPTSPSTGPRINVAGACTGVCDSSQTTMCVEDDPTTPGNRRVHACLDQQWVALPAYIAPIAGQPPPPPRPAAYTNTDIDMCIRNKCIHNEGMPLPGVAMFKADGTLCTEDNAPATQYLSYEACTQAIERSESGECPVECQHTPIPFVQSQNACGPPCPNKNDRNPFPANQCWDGQHCLPIIGTHRTQLACQQDHRCWDASRHMCYPNITDQRRCTVPSHKREILNVNEISCRFLDGTCWDTAKEQCYYDWHDIGCNTTPEFNERLLPTMPNGKVANHDTSVSECKDSLNCWKPCIDENGIYTDPRCSSSCMLSTQDICSIRILPSAWWG